MKYLFDLHEQADDDVHVNQGYSKGCMLERSRYLVDRAVCWQSITASGGEGQR